MKNWQKNIMYTLMSMFTVFGCFFDQYSLYQGTFLNQHPFIIDLTVLSLLMVILIFVYKKWDTHHLEKSKFIVVLLFSLFMILGSSFQLTDSWDMLIETPLLLGVTILRLIGYIFLFYMVFLRLDDFVNSKEKEWKSTSKLFNYIDNHPVKASFLALTICWSIYVIAFYPIVLSPDPSYQILQFFNIPTKYLTYIVPLSSKVNLTNHHPVLHTMLLGGCLKFGRFLGSDNLGLFLYSIFQITVLMCALVSTLVVLKKEEVSLRTRLIVLAIYCFVPMFPLYAMAGVKDTLYTSFMIFYCLFIYYILKKEMNLGGLHWVMFFLVLLLLALFRNNGVYVILLSMPFIIFSSKKYRKILTIIFVLFLASYLSYDKWLLPSLKITNGSEREMLSIPFQQTARLVKEHSNEIKSKDRRVIDKVLGYKTLSKRYRPEISDPVKNEYNPRTSKKDLKNYFKVWWKYLWKYPDVYISATLNNTYGYFYPGRTRWYVYTKYFPLIKEEGVVDYHYNHLESLRNVLSAYGNAFPYIPVFGLLSNIGFNTWFLFLLCIYSFHKKHRSFLLCLLPLLISLLICIASPVNAYFRYAMPYIFIMPWAIAIHLKNLRSKS